MSNSVPNRAHRATLIAAIDATQARSPSSRRRLLVLGRGTVRVIARGGRSIRFRTVLRAADIFIATPPQHDLLSPKLLRARASLHSRTHAQSALPFDQAKTRLRAAATPGPCDAAGPDYSQVL